MDDIRRFYRCKFFAENNVFKAISKSSLNRQMKNCSHGKHLIDLSHTICHCTKNEEILKEKLFCCGGNLGSYNEFIYYLLLKVIITW